ENRPPASGRRTVVHGDFRNGNLMIDENGVTGVLDWELTHLGDPAEDLGWLCVKAWRFGSPHPVGGFGPREDLLAGYAAAGGTPPTPEELRWWEVFGTLRWTILCRLQAERFLSGADRSIEYAVLGRRVCEQEFDLLLALGLAEPVTLEDPLETARGTPSAPAGPRARSAARAGRSCWGRPPRRPIGNACGSWGASPTTTWRRPSARAPSTTGGTRWSPRCAPRSSTSSP